MKRIDEKTSFYLLSARKIFVFTTGMNFIQTWNFANPDNK